MSTWYYYDTDGQKQGPVTGGQLKGLAKAGQITPETVVETEEGKTALARKVKGLTFLGATQSGSAPTETANGVENRTQNIPTPATPPAEEGIYGMDASPFTKPYTKSNSFTVPRPVIHRETPQSTSVPIAEHHDGSSWQVTLIGAVLILVVGGIAWATITVFSSKEADNVQVPQIDNAQAAQDQQEQERLAAKQREREEQNRIAAEQKERESQERIAAEKKEREEQEKVVAEQKEQEEKELLRKKIDVVCQDKGVKLSAAEKVVVAEYLFLAESKSSMKRSESDIKMLVEYLSSYLGGRWSWSSGTDTRGRYSRILGRDVRFNKVDHYVACLADYDAVNYFGSELRKRFPEELDRYAGILNIIESLLPECNRLSGNAHDAIERSRLAKKAQEEEKKQLFGK